MNTVNTYLNVYNDKNRSNNERIESLKKAYSLMKSIESTPGYEKVLKPEQFKARKKMMENILNQLGQ